ncbi:hypothetical protein ACP8HI_04920 [Paenibacillus sp. FA6]|uniref:hypothetical protein n=1 Tax=Paenibacillus sp. FA6 TaxID=3413029 RepID=UPI003F65DD4A
MSHKRILTKLAITTLMTGLLFSGAQIRESTVYAHSESPITETPHHNRQHKHQHRHGGITRNAAHLLGMESQELLKEWQKGKTLIQIAKDRKGWDEETFTKKLSEIQLKKIDTAIKSGKISKEQGDMIKRKLPEKLKNALNHKHGNHHEIQRGTFSHL